jgi:hypothetical protein
MAIDLKELEQKAHTNWLQYIFFLNQIDPDRSCLMQQEHTEYMY